MPRANVIYLTTSPRNDFAFSKERKILLFPLVVIYLLLFIPPGPKRASVFATVFQDGPRMNLTLFLMCFYGNMLSVFQVTCKWLWGHASHVNDSWQIYKWEKLATQTTHWLSANFDFFLSRKSWTSRKRIPAYKNRCFCLLV